MRIGITGATGFAGGHFASALVAAGHEVFGFGRNPDKAERLETQGVRFRSVDLRGRAGLAEAFQGLDLVVHAAALSSVWGAYSQFHENNVVGTENVVEACRVAGVGKLIYVSSSSVYFDFQDRFDIPESHELANPSPSNYTRSKVAAERAIQGASDLEWIVLRPRGIFGPGDSSIIPRVLRIARKGWFPLARGGEVLVDLTYVGNLVRVLELCIAAETKAWCQVYNVSNGQPVRIVDFFDLVMAGLQVSPKKLNTPVWLMKSLAVGIEVFARIFGLGEPPLTRYTAGLLCHHQTLDISKSRELLGYAPEVSIEEGIQRTVDFMKKEGL